MVEQARERVQRAAVEEVGDRAEQVAEQIARARLRGDVEHHLVVVTAVPNSVPAASVSRAVNVPSAVN